MSVLATAVAGRGLVAPGEPVFSAADEALLRGQAVFETARVYGGVPFRFGRHVERLRASSALVGLPEPDAAECEALASLVIAAAGPDVSLRLYWTGMTLAATAGEIPADLEDRRARGLRLASVRWSAGSLAGAKSTSYAENMAAQREAAAAGADDAILVAHDGTVLEAPTANVWWREGGRLLTPSLLLPVLAGVTRSTLLELAPAAGFETEEGTFPLERLLQADEAFLTSSIREVMPVAAVDAVSFEVGHAARALQEALRSAARVGSPS